MWIKKIWISSSNVLTKDGEEHTSFVFSKGFNLLSSNNKNSRGKTSLIRFIIWGLGFNISLTNNFNESSSEVKMLICNNPYIKYIHRRNKDVKIVNNKSKSKIFHLPNGLPDIIRLLIQKRGNQYLYSQILGLFYFDQDQGMRTWNRGNVVQPLNKNDSSYKIDFRIILSALKSIDYKKLRSERTNCIKESAYLGRLEKSMMYFSSKSKKVPFLSSNLKDKILMARLRKRRIMQDLQLYKSNKKDISEFYKLLGVLHVKIKTSKGKIVHVTTKNIVKNSEKDWELRSFISYFKIKLRRINKLINSLIVKRKKELEYETKNINFRKVNKEIALSGIDVNDLENARVDISAKKKQLSNKIKAGLYNSIQKNSWRWTVKFLNSIGIKSDNFLDKLKVGNLLTNKLPYSGSIRSLVIMSIRLSMYSAIMKYLGIKLPLIIDSPGNQEMENKWVNIFISNLEKSFPSTQLIIATNSHISDKLDYHKINLVHGVFGDLKI